MAGARERGLASGRGVCTRCVSDAILLRRHSD